jgi:hypothetical protein
VKVRNLTDDDVVIAHPDYPSVDVPAGESVEVDDALGTLLLEQPDKWAPAGPTNVEAPVPTVLAQVGDNKDRARTALEAEQAKDKPRAGLVNALTKIIES